MSDFPICRRLLSCFAQALSLSTLLCHLSGAMAQGVPLKPPVTLQPPSAILQAPAATTAPTSEAAPALTTTAGVIKFVPGKISLAQMRALPTGSMIELNNGRKIKATQFVATADALKGLSGKPAKLKRMDFTFTRPVAVAQLKLNASNLAAARAMAPNTVLELPNGLKMTTGELKQLDTLEARTNIRQMLGAQAGAGAAAANKYAGRPAIKLRTKADIEQLKGKPDSTIVEAPDGSRSTLGELKAALAEKFGGVRK
jgi:hypothetical protein